MIFQTICWCIKWLSSKFVLLYNKDVSFICLWRERVKIQCWTQRLCTKSLKKLFINNTYYWDKKGIKKEIRQPLNYNDNAQVANLIPPVLKLQKKVMYYSASGSLTHERYLAYARVIIHVYRRVVLWTVPTWSIRASGTIDKVASPCLLCSSLQWQDKNLSNFPPFFPACQNDSCKNSLQR